VEGANGLMPTEWRAPFRKLQERCSTSFLRLPAWVRGYSDEMIRFAERPYGRVCDTANPADVAFRIRAHESESEQVAEAVRLLTAQGFLSTEQDGLYITNFAKAQENYEATRKREWRLGQQNVSGTVRDNPDAHGTVPQEERREDKIREEDPPVVPRSGDGQVVREVFEFWQTERRKPRAKLDRKRAGKIRARLAEGHTPEQLKQAIRNAKNDPFLMGGNDRGKVFDDLVTLLRDGPKVEELIALNTPPPTPAPRGFGRENGIPERELTPDERERNQRLLAQARRTVQ
jgi:hypothetical protein